MKLSGLSRLEAVGTLELLWLFTMEHAPSGDVGKWPDEDIELECEWSGAPGALVDALIQSGWVDRCAVHRLVIHDWGDHLPEFLRLRVRRGNLEIYSPTPPNIPEGENDQSRLVNDQPETDVSTTVVEREGKGREAKGREGKPDRTATPSPSATESCEWIIPLLKLQRRSTDAERRTWLDAYWDEICSTAEIEAEDPSKLAAHIKRYAIRKWQAYLKTSGPSEHRQFAREAHRLALEAAKAELDSGPRDPPADLSRPPDDDPLALLRAGDNPNARPN